MAKENKDYFVKAEIESQIKTLNQKKALQNYAFTIQKLQKTKERY